MRVIVKKQLLIYLNAIKKKEKDLNIIIYGLENWVNYQM